MVNCLGVMTSEAFYFFWGDFYLFEQCDFFTADSAGLASKFCPINYWIRFFIQSCFSGDQYYFLLLFLISTSSTCRYSLNTWSLFLGLLAMSFLALLICMVDKVSTDPLSCLACGCWAHRCFIRGCWLSPLVERRWEMLEYCRMNLCSRAGEVPSRKWAVLFIIKYYTHFIISVSLKPIITHHASVRYRGLSPSFLAGLGFTNSPLFLSSRAYSLKQRQAWGLIFLTEPSSSLSPTILPITMILSPWLSFSPWQLAVSLMTPSVVCSSLGAISLRYSVAKRISTLQFLLSASLGDSYTRSSSNLFIKCISATAFRVSEPAVIIFCAMTNMVSLYSSTIRGLSLSEFYPKIKELYAKEPPLDVLYQYPADVEFIGTMHKHNTNFGVRSLLAKDNEGSCPCCCSHYYTHQAGLSISSTSMTPSLSELERMEKSAFKYPFGSEVTLYFTFVKAVVIALLLRVLLFDWVLMAKGVFFKAKCYSRHELTKQGYLLDEDYILNHQVSLSQKLAIAFYKYEVVAFMLIGLVVVSIVCFWISVKWHFRIYEGIQASQDYESRYAVIVDSIPLVPVIPRYSEKKYHNISYEKRLKEFFKIMVREQVLEKLKAKVEGKDVSLNQEEKAFLALLRKTNQLNFAKLEENCVREVIVCYETTCLSRLHLQKEKLMHSFSQHIYASREEKKRSLEGVKRELRRLNERHARVLREFNSSPTLDAKLPYFMGFAIVVFDYQHYRDAMIGHSLAHPGHFAFNQKQRVRVHAAQKPSVLEWDNIMFFVREQEMTRVYTNLILFMVLFITLMAFSYLELYKVIPFIQQLIHFPKKYQHRLKVTIISCITSLINLLLSKIIWILAATQKRSTKTGTIISLLTKNVITQFINSALIYYLITMVTPSSYLFEMKDLRRKVESLIMIPGTVKILVDFINARYIIKKVQFEIYSSETFQIQFNKLYERPEFDFVTKYTHYIVQLLTVSFYAPLTPMIVPALAVILPVQYMVDKLILFKKSAMPAKISFRVLDWAHFLAECSLLSFLAGWLLFCPVELWTQTTMWMTYIALGLVVCYLGFRLRMQYNFDSYHPTMQKSSKTHTQVTNMLMERYHNYNPWQRFHDPNVPQPGSPISEPPKLRQRSLERTNSLLMHHE